MSAADTSLPLRSLLFAPGNEPRKVQKVATFGSDAIILDLEDAVPDADKVATRPLVRAVLADLATVGPLVFVRVNSLAVASAPGAAGVRVWAIMSRGAPSDGATPPSGAPNAPLCWLRSAGDPCRGREAGRPQRRAFGTRGDGVPARAVRT